MPGPSPSDELFKGNMVKYERDRAEYYKRVAETQAGVIRQLSGRAKATDPVYIHPMDLHEMVEKLPLQEMIFVIKPDVVLSDLIAIRGIRYFQTPFIPAKSNLYV